MVPELDSLLSWLGEHSAAVQAFASLVTVTLTAVLCIITAKYVFLTADMSKNSAKQVLAMLQPDCVMTYRIDEEEPWLVRVRIDNKGQYPLKLIDTEICCKSASRGRVTKRLHLFDNELVSGKIVRELFWVIPDDIMVMGENRDGWSLELHSHFSDIWQITTSCYRISGMGIWHSLISECEGMGEDDDPIRH